jgi:ubiquinone/menaquinone biosynthesis C-methylase UbiE
VTEDDSRMTTYKAGVREGFEKISEKHVKWWEVLRQAGQAVSELLIDSAGIRPGDRVLDIGTGIGEPALTAAAAVGPSGHVVGTDIAADMIEYGRTRIAAQGVANVELRVLDAEQLDFPAQSFDAVISRFAFQFIGDLPRVIRNCHDVLVDGGRLAFAVLGTPSQMPTRSLILKALEDVLGPEALAYLPVAERDPAKFQRLMVDGGFADASVTTTRCPNFYRNADEFICMSLDIDVVATAHPEAREALEAHMADQVKAYEAPDGSLTFQNQFLIGVGTR